ncbi:peptidase C25-like protein [Tahibacter aquaticus]|uniref:Peptidase C25-like protein n=1 Tax=Tahibacter aquaticus TaxID=520092 RepID=A0A4R6YSH8_9GAMM|nr:C25 family cysteine peptidase [Tahibacter aquaticus]TDR41106.1 peptidase C25-like protein [Tahibacter aquaticus]
MLPYSRRVALALFAALPGSAALACSGGLHIEIESPGVYALDQASLVAAAPQLADCPRDSLVLTQRGKEVPIRISGSGATLQPGDHIEWVGQALHGPLSWFDSYSTVNVYQLGSRSDGGAPARIVDASAAHGGASAPLSRRLHLEQENLMIRLNQAHVKQWAEPDYWHWAKLTHVDPDPVQIDFDLPDLAARSGSVTFKLKFRGMSQITPLGQPDKPLDHQVRVQLGGKPVAEFTWDGRAEVEHALSVPVASLREQGNRLTLNVPKRQAKPADPNPIVDVVMFNSLDLDYPVNGNIDRSAESLYPSGAGSVVLGHGGGQLSAYSEDGRRWLAQGDQLGRIDAGVELYPIIDQGFAKPQRIRPMAGKDWRTPDAPIDYIIISHSRLIDAIQPLAEFHRKRGLRVAVIDVDDVYDQFNHGITHPQAIRNLMEQAYKHWPAPQPRFALLVGDASFDIRHQRVDRRNLAKWADSELLMPGQFGDISSTPYADTPSELKHRALIPTWQFVSYDGQSASDNHFVSVGEDGLHPVIAIGRFPVVRPDEVKAIVDKTIAYLSTPQLGAWRRDVMFITDESDYFKNSSDQIAKSLDSEGFLTDKVYASADEKDNLAHQSSIKDGLNEGRLLVHFIGHGGRYIWRTGPPDLRKNHDLFTLEDVSGLNNGARLPMILSMTCYSAPFDNPTEDSIGERFLREPGKGAVAVFAASWRNSPSPQYSKVIVEQLTKPGVTIGEAIIAGKKPIQDDTLVETYNLLGDPAVVLERPAGEFQLARKARPFGPDAIEASVQRTSFRGMAEVNWVDATGKSLFASRFAVLGPRFTLPEPPAEVRATATEVRGYIADPANPFDAIAMLDLSSAAPAQPKLNAEALSRLKKTPDRVSQGDVILGTGFDQAAPVETGKNNDKVATQ